MKSKYIYIYIYISLIITIISGSSCINDTGNYDYLTSDELLPVKVSALRDTTVVQGTTLNITSEVKINGDESKYSYLWYAIPAGGNGEKVELATTKDLSAVISLISGNYILCFEVIDAKLDIAVITKANLTVQGTVVGLGWFILKDTNNETDFDYINPQGVLYQDILRGIGPDYLLKGTAVGMAFQKSGYKQEIIGEDGRPTVLALESIYHVLSSEDMKTFNSKTMGKYKDFDDEFYEAPAVRKPQHCIRTRMEAYLLNDGSLWSYLDWEMGVGKFATGLYWPGHATYLHRDIMLTQMGPGIAFDTISRSFLGYGLMVPLSPFSDENGSISPTNMDYRLLNMLQVGDPGLTFILEGFAVMQSVNPQDKRFYFAKISMWDLSEYPFEIQPELIPDNCRMPMAPVKAASRQGNVIYFAEGNRLSFYAHASNLVNRETLIKTFGADETISYIRDYGRSEFGAEHDLVVLTNSPRGWKFYVHKINTPGEIEAQPHLVLEGTGNGRFVMQRIARMNE